MPEPTYRDMLASKGITVLQLSQSLPRSSPIIKAAGQLSTSEAGHAGTTYQQPSQTPGITFGAGIVPNETEYNPDLRGTALYDVVDKMRLSDSVVKGMLRAVKLPLLSADWDFEPGDDTPEAEEIAAWCTSQLEQMNWTWQTVLRHILLYLDYGSMPFEIVFEVADDLDMGRPMARLRKLAPRMPRTIKEWVLDDKGGLAGIVQSSLVMGAIKDIPIPIEKLLVFVNELEGANWRGISLLRAAYKDWYYKDRFQRLGGIIMEKRGAGIDVGTLTRGDPAKQRHAERVLMSVRTHERGFIVENEDFKYRVEGTGAGTVLDPLPWVNYYDLSMLRGLLVEFLQLGGSDAGSWALSKDKTTFFLMSLNSVGEEVRQVVNRHLVPRWVNANWANVKPSQYPKLNHSRLDRRDAAMVVNSIAQLIPQQVLTIDDDLEREVRDLLDLPELPDEPIERRRGPAIEPNDNPEDGGEPILRARRKVIKAHNDGPNPDLPPLGGEKTKDQVDAEFSDVKLKNDHDATVGAIEAITKQLKLSQASTEALDAYTGGGKIPDSRKTDSAYTRINNLLRGVGKEKEIDKVQALIKDIDTAMASSKVERDVIIYRGMMDDQRAGKNRFRPSTMEIGTEFTDAGFVSGTADVYHAANFAVQVYGEEKGGALMKIKVPQGFNALPGEAHEKELILPKGTKFKITGKSTKVVKPGNADADETSLLTIFTVEVVR